MGGDAATRRCGDTAKGRNGDAAMARAVRHLTNGLVTPCHTGKERYDIDTPFQRVRGLSGGYVAGDADHRIDEGFS